MPTAPDGAATSIGLPTRTAGDAGVSGTYVVTASITVRVENAEAVHQLAASAGVRGGDERAELEGAVAAGLAELPAVVGRYGFEIVASEGHVTPQG